MVKPDGIEIALFRGFVIPGLGAKPGERGRQGMWNQSKCCWTTRRISKDRNLSRAVCDCGIWSSQGRLCIPDIGFLLGRQQESTCPKWVGNTIEPIVVSSNL